MSKASNQNKRLRKRRNKSSPRASELVSSRRSAGRTRNRCRRAAWLKKRATAEQASAKPVAKVRRDIPLSQTSLASKPLVRGNLQKVITKNGSHSAISEISREATAGGVIYRFSKAGGLEILLILTVGPFLKVISRKVRRLKKRRFERSVRRRASTSLTLFAGWVRSIFATDERIS